MHLKAFETRPFPEYNIPQLYVLSDSVSRELNILNAYGLTQESYQN